MSLEEIVDRLNTITTRLEQIGEYIDRVSARVESLEESRDVTNETIKSTTMDHAERDTSASVMSDSDFVAAFKDHCKPKKFAWEMNEGSWTL